MLFNCAYFVHKNHLIVHFPLEIVRNILGITGHKQTQLNLACFFISLVHIPLPRDLTVQNLYILSPCARYICRLIAKLSV